MHLFLFYFCVNKSLLYLSNKFKFIINLNYKTEDNQDRIDNCQEDEYVGPVLPGGHRFDRKFICVKYPGNVINPDKAIETLGGIQSISTVLCYLFRKIIN